MSRRIQNLFDLSGRVALVTGASRGLGYQMAEALGEAGAKLAITARKEPELAAAVKRLEERGTVAKAWTCDMNRREAIVPMAEKVLAHYGKIDILVNNAGTSWGAPAEDHPIEGWDKVVNINLTSVFLLSQYVVKHSMMPAGWGRIINMSSLAGLGGVDKRIMRTIAYCATKGGLVNMSKSMAAEWGSHGIVANTICPGFFPTQFAEVPVEKSGELIRELTPNGRLGNDEDLKGLTVLLASDAASHINGQAIAVDGGASVI